MKRIWGFENLLMGTYGMGETKNVQFYICTFPN